MDADWQSSKPAKQRKPDYFTGKKVRLFHSTKIAIINASHLKVKLSDAELTRIRRKIVEELDKVPKVVGHLQQQRYGEMCKTGQRSQILEREVKSG